MSVTYGKEFYESIAAWSRSSAAAVAPRVHALAPATSAVDVGCGDGTWLAELQALGVARVLGVDGHALDACPLRIPEHDYRQHDLCTPLRVEPRFDLELSLEVAEHLPPEHASGFVETLTALSDLVLFSAAVPCQGGTGHVNEQWPPYWVSLFAARGYAAVDCLRAEVWDDPQIAWWYRQNLLLFANDAALARWPGVAAARAASPSRVLSLVHPVAYLWRSLPPSS